MQKVFIPLTNKTMTNPIIAMSYDEYAALDALKKTVAETCALLDKQHTMIEIMSGYITDNLELFEQLFESDEGFCDASPEQMSSYITIARWMKAKYGRKHIADRVEERMNRLPF